MVWTGFNWLRIAPVTGSCEHGNQTSGSITGKFERLLAYKEGLCSMEFVLQSFVRIVKIIFCEKSFVGGLSWPSCQLKKMTHIIVSAHI
jgi:hypothetical protein